jgi:hypothetical protein
MRAFRRICGELKPLEMPSKMKRAARLREERVNQEILRAARFVDRVLQADNGRPSKASKTGVSCNQYGDAGCRDEFTNSRELAVEADCEECPFPMDRRPTLRRVRSWGRADQSSLGMRYRSPVRRVPASSRGAERSATLAWQACPWREFPRAFRQEKENHPARRIHHITGGRPHRIAI